jgi:hypothetical protein
VCTVRVGVGHCSLVGVTRRSYTWVMSSGSGVATRTKPPHHVTGYLISSHDDALEEHIARAKQCAEAFGYLPKESARRRKKCAEPFRYLPDEPARRRKKCEESFGYLPEEPGRRRKKRAEPFGYLPGEAARRRKNNTPNPSVTSSRNPQGDATEPKA